MASLPERAAGLAAAGAAFWTEVTARFDSWRPDGARLLESACRTIDMLDRLDTVMTTAPLTAPGSAGQQRENPRFAEARQQRMALVRIMRALDLPVSAERTALRDSASVGARALARQRWG